VERDPELISVRRDGCQPVYWRCITGVWLGVCGTLQLPELPLDRSKEIGHNRDKAAALECLCSDLAFEIFLQDKDCN
jgi:hypothetical protein